MCVGENCAPQAVHYMNAQLAALHDNAIACLKDHNVNHKEPEQTKYSHALAEYTFRDAHTSRQQTMFHAKFDRPKLEFICNHDVILHLKIRNGHYRLDYNKASDMSYSQKDLVQALKEVDVAFRIHFDIHGLTGRDSKIGNSQNLIQLLILDLPKAHIISSDPAIIIGRDAFVHYMSQYLVFLHQAGNHVLFSLPDFDDDEYRLTIDYSLMESRVPEVHEIHGISVDKINTYLSSVWLKAAMFLDGADGVVSDWKHACLAEYRSTWSHHGDVDQHFLVRLGAPRIKPICSREVILYFTIDEVSFYESVDFDVDPCNSYSGWEIAVLVDVIHEKDHSGNVTYCKLDLSTARPYHLHCKFGEIDPTDVIAVAYFTRILDFFTVHYLHILESIELHVIYHFDVRWAIHDFPTGSDVGDSGFEGSHVGEWDVNPVDKWEETLTLCKMYGLDQITAISQSSIIEHFRGLWTVGHSARFSEASSLVKWEYEKYFSATFDPITIRLLSNSRAIVWIHIKRGHLKPLKHGHPSAEHEDYHFDDWHLAFEVDLTKCAHNDLQVSGNWRHKYKETAVYKAHGHHTDRFLEHLCLNMHNAEFLHEFSTLHGLFQQHHHHHHHHHHRPIDQLRAAIHYMQKHYLPHLVHSGLNIIHTLPIWISGDAKDHPTCALTSVAFHVYSKTVITRHTWSHAAIEPVILVLGMSGYRALPCTHLEFSASWVVRVTKALSYGTVCISRASFMEKRLLQLLTKINTLTTVVPKFYGVHDDVWSLELSTWAEHDWRKNHACNWVPVVEGDGFMKYKWQHRDCWNYEHEGSGDVANGTYSVHCFTRNFVEMPTATRHKSLDIRISGEVELKMSYNSGTQSGSAKSTASWHALLCVHTDIYGLKVSVVGSPTVKIEKTEFEGNFHSAKFPDLHASLQKHLPKTVDFSEVLQELRTFEGVWQYGFHGTQAYYLANPVFTHHGDLMFELRPQGQQTLRPKPSAGHLHIGTTASSVARSDSFFGKVKSAIQSALLDSSTNGHVHESADVNGHNGHAHVDVVVNGSSHSGGAYALNTMTYDVEVKEDIDYEEESVEQLSFLVPEVEVVN